MKRPTFALLSVLLLLALGLVASGPRSTNAGSLGELAFAMQIESTDAGDPIVCPMVCCPLVDEEPEATEPSIELNAAETNDSEAEQLASDEYDYYADEYAYDDEYYYDDGYYEEYGYEYGDEYYEDEPSDMELNAAETSENEHLVEDGCWDEYYGDYAYDYTDFDDESTSADSALSNCNDACHPPAAESDHTAGSQVCDTDLVVETDSYDCPYDCYGHQVGDEYHDSYYEDYYYEDYYGEQFDADEVTSEDASDEMYTESYEEDYERYYTEEYYEQLPDPSAESTSSAVEETYADEYEDFYDDYYGEDFYNEYDEAEADSSVEPVEDAADWIDDYTSEYDAIYDNAVYGEPLENARTEVPSPPVVDDACLRDAYVLGDCIDERNSELIDDLPWADEVDGDCHTAMADVAEIDIPNEGTCSEYGTDYAEEYYDAYFDWIEEHSDVAPADELSDEYYEMYFDWVEQQDDEVAHAEACRAASPVATAKTVHKTFDVTAYATYWGERFAKLTDSLSGLGRAIRTAAVDLETRSR